MDKNILYLNESPMTDIDYFQRFFSDADDMSVSVVWRFDEQQADGFNHSFKSHEFFRRLRRMVNAEDYAINQSKAAHAEIDRIEAKEGGDE